VIMDFREQVERDVQFSRTMSQAEMQQLQIRALLMIDDALRAIAERLDSPADYETTPDEDE